MFYCFGLSFRDTLAQSLFVNNVIYECFVLWRKCWKGSKMSIVYGGKVDSSGPRIVFLEACQKTMTSDLKHNYDAETNNSVVEKIKNRVRRTSKIRQTSNSWIK